MPGLSDGGCMFLSMSTARTGGVTLSGFSLLCNKGSGSQSTTQQNNQMQIHYFLNFLLTVKL